MNMPNTLQRLDPLLRRELGLDASATITMATELADLGADSLDLVEIAMEMEKEFGRDIDELAWATPVRVADLVAAVEGIR